MGQGFLGEIRMFGGSFAPRTWAFCKGQLVPISQYEALYAILGTTFGGDGQSTFGLPDFRSRIPIGVGQGSGLTARVLGEMGGQETVTLTQNQVPAHTHPFMASTDKPNNTPALTPSGSVLAKPNSGTYNTSTTPIQMAPTGLNVIGSSGPHTNIQPFLGMNFIICLEGIFPSQG